MSRLRRRLPNALAVPLLLLGLAPAAAPAQAAGGVTAQPGAVVHGFPTVGHPSVGLLTYEGLECAATLIGCRTAVTAAHCLCYDAAFDPPRLLRGDECRSHEGLADPATKRLFFQHAGWVGIEEMLIHPGWDGSGGDDLAVLRLDRSVSGLVPAPINDVSPVPPGTRGELVAFGRTRRDLADQGIKRTGPVIADPCGPDFLCWWLSQTPDPGASLAGLCFHDSGGAVLADLPGVQGGPWLVGVNQSTSSDTCLPPSFNLATGLYSRREWLAEASGGDLGLPPGTPTGEGCGGLAAVGGTASRIRGATGPLSDDRREAGFYVDVPPGTGVLRVTLTATGRVEPADNDFDLYLRRGAMPDPEDPDGPGAGVDCASTGPSGVEACEIRSPGPGAWYALVRWVKGDGRYQLVATQLDGEPPPEEPEPEEPEEPEEPAEPGAPGGPAEPPPPELPWLTAPGFPGFEAKVRIGAVAGASVTPCVSESLCVSGALPGRPEVFVKVVGPRPNGHLWVQVARFTPARVEIWLRRTATGRVNHYVLDPVGPASPGVPGLQDRLAFPE